MGPICGAAGNRTPPYAGGWGWSHIGFFLQMHDNAN